MTTPLTHTRAFLVAVLACGSALVTGCKTTANGLNTNELAADFTVHQTVDGATVKVEYHQGAPLGPFVELGSGDHISCNGIELQKVEVAPAVWYAGVAGGLPEGAAYAFQLRRELEAYNPAPGNGPSQGYSSGAQNPMGGTSDTPQSFITYVPAVKSFGVTQPTGGATLKFGQTADIRWANSGSDQKMSVTLEGDCIDTVTDSGLQDTGWWSIDGSRIKGKGTSSCDGKLTVTRFRNDPILGSAYKTAKSESYYDDVTKLTLSP